MKEYRVRWIQCPTAYNTPRVLFVEANNSKDAETIARDYIERQYGIAQFKIDLISETEPLPEGKVKR